MSQHFYLNNVALPLPNVSQGAVRALALLDPILISLKCGALENRGQSIGLTQDHDQFQPSEVSPREMNQI